MYYEKHNNANAETLILLHSGGMGAIEWQPQIKYLTSSFNLLIPDLPGHGRSQLNEGEQLSISLMGQAVVSMLEKEGVNQAHILGSSMGGAVALWIALNYPHVVDKLIIYRIGYSKNDDTYEQTLAMADPEYWRQYGMHQWLSKLHEPQGGKDAWQNVIANVSRVLNPESSEHNHSLEDLKTIKAKTLLIAGDRDPLIPTPTLLEMANAIPNSAIWIMPQASHITATNTWRAASFAEEVSRFLR